MCPPPSVGACPCSPTPALTTTHLLPCLCPPPLLQCAACHGLPAAAGRGHPLPACGPARPPALCAGGGLRVHRLQHDGLPHLWQQPVPVCGLWDQRQHLLRDAAGQLWGRQHRPASSGGTAGGCRWWGRKGQGLQRIGCLFAGQEGEMLVHILCPLIESGVGWGVTNRSGRAGVWGFSTGWHPSDCTHTHPAVSCIALPHSAQRPRHTFSAAALFAYAVCCCCQPPNPPPSPSSPSHPFSRCRVWLAPSSSGPLSCWCSWCCSTSCWPSLWTPSAR